MKNFLTVLMVIALYLGMAIGSDATLIDRGGGLIYDSDLNITWLQESYHSSMNWYQAKEWAENLVYFDPVRNTNWNDWRLPITLNQDGSGPCYGYNCTGSEIGHLYYVDLGTQALLLTWGTITGSV